VAWGYSRSIVPARLAERLAAAHGAPIEVDGKLVHMLFELPPIDVPAQLRIALRAGSARPQAVRLKVREGTLLVSGERADDVVLWSDSAPPVVTASVRPLSAGKPATLRVWNAWRDPAGTMQAWIGDAGMLVEEPGPGEFVLRCSDGFDAPTFDDLVVRLSRG
jgi:hypothetical protein